MAVMVDVHVLLDKKEWAWVDWCLLVCSAQCQLVLHRLIVSSCFTARWQTGHFGPHFSEEWNLPLRMSTLFQITAPSRSGYEFRSVWLAHSVLMQVSTAALEAATSFPEPRERTEIIIYSWRCSASWRSYSSTVPDFMGVCLGVILQVTNLFLDH